MNPLALVRSAGSMGSEFMQLATNPEDVLLLARLDWRILTPRVSIDPESDLISLVTPSRSHIDLLVSAEMVVRRLARALEIPQRQLPWPLLLRRAGDPEHTGAEPAAAWYLDKTVRDWKRAVQQDRDSLSDFVLRTPPDLVVEIERNPNNGDRAGVFRRLGARELWWLDMAGEQPDLVMLDLQAPDSPQETAMSEVLPSVGMALLSEALDLAGRERYDELSGLIDGLRPDRVSG